MSNANNQPKTWEDAKKVMADIKKIVDANKKEIERKGLKK